MISYQQLTLILKKTPTSYAIFRIQSGVCQLFREFLLKNSFMEIHSPKLLGTASESGSSVFKVQYFNCNLVFLKTQL